MVADRRQLGGTASTHPENGAWGNSKDPVVVRANGALEHIVDPGSCRCRSPPSSLIARPARLPTSRSVFSAVTPVIRTDADTPNQHSPSATPTTFTYG